MTLPTVIARWELRWTIRALLSPRDYREGIYPCPNDKDDRCRSVLGCYHCLCLTCMCPESILRPSQRLFITASRVATCEERGLETMERRQGQGCLAGLFELFMLNAVFDWLQDNLGFGRKSSCAGCGCGLLLLILFVFLACSIIFNTNWTRLSLSLFQGLL